MHDIKYIRAHAEEFEQKLKRRGEDVNVEELINLDTHKREIIQNIDRMRERRNAASKETGVRKKSGQNIDELRSEVLEIGAKLKEAESNLRELDERINN